MAKLKDKNTYVHGPRGFHWKAGTTIEVDEGTAAWLAVDSPGTFEPVTAKPTKRTAAVAEPKTGTKPKGRRKPAAKSG